MPALLTLPTELVLEVFKHLGWKDILAARRTCKLLFDVSHVREVWISLFRRLSRELPVPPVLERSLSAYTSTELEKLLMHRISSEVRWAHTKAPSQMTFRRGYPHEDDNIILLDGGRWLLATFYANDEWGRVYAYDLESTSDPEVLIDLGITGCLEDSNSWFMAADRDVNDESTLAFTLCLSPCRRSRPGDKGYATDWPVAGIHIYRIIVKGREKEATLEAHEMKTLTDTPIANVEGLRLVYDIFLQGDYLVRCLDLTDTVQEAQDFEAYGFEVYNWAKSNSSVQYTTCITGVNPADLPSCVLLVPDDKLLVLAATGISVYDLTNLEPSRIGAVELPVLQPYWHFLTLTYSIMVDFSKSHRGSHASRATILLDSLIFGLIIPHDIREQPSYQQLSDYPISKAAFTCLGVSKLYYADNKEMVGTMGLMWDSDNADLHADKPLLDLPVQHPFQRELEASLYPWNSKPEIPPLFDESSNRIVTFADNSWMFLDFGYTC